MRRLKVARLLDTLPERLTLARNTTSPTRSSSRSCSPTKFNDATAHRPGGAPGS